MKSLVLGFLFLSGMARAEALKVKVIDFNFNYENPYGEGTALSFSRNQFNDQQVQVTVNKVNKDFKFLVMGSENHEFDLKNAPDFMTKAETMNLNSFNLNLDQNLDLLIKSARFISKKNSLKLDSFSLSCFRELGAQNLLDQLLLGCTQKLNLKSSKFSSQKTTEMIANALGSSINGLVINNVEIQINAGKFELNAEVKADISGKVKGRGSISYDPSSGKVIVKIDEVKFGILNITGRVFDEIKKKENEKLKVKEPYLYYSLK